MKVETVEMELGMDVPVDYLNYRGERINQETKVFFRMENCLFWDLNTSFEHTIKLRNSGTLTKNDFAFAVNEDNEVLFYQNSKKTSTKISHLDEEYDGTFYAYSLTEFTNYRKTQKLMEEIESVGFVNQDLGEIENCVGSLFQYALALNASEYHDTSEDRSKKALELFFKAAEMGHPEAAHEIADHYYFQENVDADKVIEWREKAIALGSKADVLELADYIIDEKTEEVDRAVLLLESLLADKWYRERALLRLSRIYMRGTGGKIDQGKGIQYGQECAELGNYNALSDLAFYHYKGRGVDKNLQKAHELLVKAEERITEKTGSGMWGGFIKQLERDLASEV
ncbi:tetratricopeptide repeat protein [Pontibacter amylolyticus]|uniref:Sel1 repeat family protein n=1 Tax=Pontibacter amylolyticus TaxID=1424080 RepID=A0ABQ1W5H6_9BACT|nr:tetratricopeptide repeat protein [Pontibacter amylolyticus]GGG13612.1 hypothetical protein GCM10011323_17560 [Pontibacter amylolyticus]